MSDEPVTVSRGTAEVMLRELDILIDATEDTTPDPLQDDVFQARQELAEKLGVEESYQGASTRGVVSWQDDVPHEFLDLFVQTIEQSNHMTTEWVPDSDNAYDKLLVKEVRELVK
jgi:hypothetical protein